MPSYRKRAKAPVTLYGSAPDPQWIRTGGREGTPMGCGGHLPDLPGCSGRASCAAASAGTGRGKLTRAGREKSPVRVAAAVTAAHAYALSRAARASAYCRSRGAGRH